MDRLLLLGLGQQAYTDRSVVLAQLNQQKLVPARRQKHAAASLVLLSDRFHLGQAISLDQVIPRIREALGFLRRLALGLQKAQAEKLADATNDVVVAADALRCLAPQYQNPLARLQIGLNGLFDLFIARLRGEGSCVLGSSEQSLSGVPTALSR